VKDFSRGVLLSRGIALAERFCVKNEWPAPLIKVVGDGEPWRIRACAYYRPNPHRIVINPPACGKVGRGGRSWSFPGYIIDRTPYGVLQHELGHFVDYHLSTLAQTLTQPVLSRHAWQGFISRKCHETTQEDPLSGYAPDDGEWWAEMMRLFITNPDLFKRIRPKTYAYIVELGVQPVESGTWRTVLRFAPRRTREMAARRIKEAKGVAA
jgi:hypothetical protein